MRPPYNANPAEIYTLELNKLQLTFSQLLTLAEGVSDIDQQKIEWSRVSYLRQFRFILQEAAQVGVALLEIK